VVDVATVVDVVDGWVLDGGSVVVVGTVVVEKVATEVSVAASLPHAVNKKASTKTTIERRW
jgi:hypothetical protein